MKSSDIPTRFNLPFAKNATLGYVRPIPDFSPDPAAASLNLGFPPETATPIEAGGVPPQIADMNGILERATAWSQWQGAGGPVPWDSGFATAINGYPAGAIVQAASGAGNYWYCTADDNITDPDTGGANWTEFNLLGRATLDSPHFTGTPQAPTNATASDASDEIATDHFVQNAILQFAKTIGTNGSYALPGGLILKWGVQGVTFPGTTSFVQQAIPFAGGNFPNNCFAAFAIANTNVNFNPSVAGDNFVCTVPVKSVSGMTARVDTNSGGSPTGAVIVYYFAIGN